MKKNILLAFLSLVNLYVSANNVNKINQNDTNIVGDVRDKKSGEHLAYITVSIKGTTLGTTTDVTGHYFLKGLPIGKFILEARFVGYKSQEIEIILEKEKTYEINFLLEEDNISLNEVVVSANRNETSRRLAPTLVSILDTKVFEQTSSVSLSQGLNFQPGLRVEDNCQNCGFTQVRMNGLEGAYSQILIDSRPIFSALAGVYGLEQIPANMVERVEIVRGGGSALYGASAIAGTINIITKEPIRNSAELSHNLMAFGGTSSFDNATNMNVSLVSENQKMGLMLFGQKRHRAAFDKDEDGFSELPKLDNRTVGFRSFIKTGIYSKLTFEYHNIQEFRRGGDRLDLPPFQAYIAEQIESKIDVGNIKFDLNSFDNKHHISTYLSGQLVDRDSYYGGGDPAGIITGEESPEQIENYNNRMNSFGKTKDKTYTIGTQYIYNIDKLLFMPADFTAGVEYTYDKLTDKSGYRDIPISQNTDTKSLFAQNEWKKTMWSFLVGARLDKHNLLSDVIFSPRANIRYNPLPDINIRLSYGQGFRAPQIFDEDLHVNIASGEQIISIQSDDLREEKSHSISASIDWYRQIGGCELNFLVEAFLTRLLHPFASLYEDQPDKTIIRKTINESGAKVYGFNLETRTGYRDLLQFQMGLTVQKSRFDNSRKWSNNATDNVESTKKMMRTPDIYGYFLATVTPLKKLNTTLSGNYTGTMLVPHEAHTEITGIKVDNYTKKTQKFFTLNWKISYSIPLYKGSDIEFSTGVQNIFNSYQKDLDKGAGRASSYIYGPSLPRSYLASLKICY